MGDLLGGPARPDEGSVLTLLNRICSIRQTSTSRERNVQSSPVRPRADRPDGVEPRPIADATALVGAVTTLACGEDTLSPRPCNDTVRYSRG